MILKRQLVAFSAKMGSFCSSEKDDCEKKHSRFLFDFVWRRVFGDALLRGLIQSLRFIDDGLIGKFVKRFAAAEGYGALDHFRFGKREAEFGVAVQIGKDVLQQLVDRLWNRAWCVWGHPAIQGGWGNTQSFGNLLARQAVSFEFFDDGLTCHSVGFSHFGRKNRVLFSTDRNTD